MGQIEPRVARPLVVAVVGPTAAGKTAIGLELAQRLGGEIVSADARQVYRYMNIGTAKPTAEDLRRIPHHLIDIIDPHEGYNAGRFKEEARAAIDAVISRRALPIVVGGSGLYVRAALDGLFEGPGADARIRQRLENLWKREGEEALRAALRSVDPALADRIEPGKPRRLIRAIEVFELTGTPLSEHHRQQGREAPYDVLWIGVAPDRQELFRRIDLRVNSMIQLGLVDEVRGLLARGYQRTLNALNTVGYREVFDFLDGHTGESPMVLSIQTHTRQYAKRQMTWFKADDRIQWLREVNRRMPVELAADIAALIASRN